MKIKNSIEVNQSQRVTINLQMQQSLQILRLSYSEMIEKINKELEKNPLLELELKKEEKNLYNQKIHFNNKENYSKSRYIENTLEQKKSLRDHIGQQINIDINNNEENITSDCDCLTEIEILLDSINDQLSELENIATALEISNEASFSRFA